MTNSIVQVSSLQVSDLDGQLVIDSRLIALNLGVQHETVIKNIRKYADKFQAMGHLRFEIGTVTNSVGATNQVNFVYLNELQSNFLMTLSKNTDAVVECKFNLSIAFDKAKSIIKTVIPALSEELQLSQQQNENLKLRLQLAEQTSTLVALHGESLGLAIAGFDGQVVEVRIATTEVLNPVTGYSDEFLSATQLSAEVKRRTGQNIKNADFIRKLKAANRDDLILPVTRNATCEYVQVEDLDDAIKVVFGTSKQGILKPVGQIIPSRK